MKEGRLSKGRSRKEVRFTAAPSKAELPADYATLLADLKQRISNERLRVVLSANAAMVLLYWDIGQVILERQAKEGWGAKVIDRLSSDLREAFPDMKGLSPRNLKYMRAFAEAWPDRAIVQRVVAQLPWRQNIALLERLNVTEDRLWYAGKVLEHGWSQPILCRQIENVLHKRQGRAVTNFPATLPPTDSDLAAQVFKDPYLFDFLGTADPRREQEVERALTDHIQRFLLELGAGFAFIGRQVHLEIENQDFYLDLLFYHVKLHCHVVVELKAVPFDPAFVGKLNLYLSAVDDLLRQPEDKPTIGLLLCRSKKKLTVEYALRDLRKPIGVASWETRIVKSLPREFKDILPTVEETREGIRGMTMLKPLTKSPHERPLPSGWRWARLGEVVQEAQAGFACGERDAEGIVQLRMNNLDTRGNFIWNDVLRVPKEGNNIEPFLLEPGDVLFNNTNSTELVGKSALFTGYVEPIVYSNHFTRLRTISDALLPEILASWLNQQWQQGVFAAICNSWIGQSAVKADKLLNLDIPLPPLAEQRRIAAILNEQMAVVEKARAAAQARLEAVKALPAAFLRQIFPQPGQPLPNGWRWVRLDDVCEVRLGKMLSPASKVGNRSVPYIRNANVQWNRFNLADVAEMDFSEDQESILKLKIGDLLVCEGGEPGRAAVWQGQISRCCYQKALHRLRPINDAIDPFFVMYRLWHGASNSEFTDSNAKTTIAHLPAIRLKSLKIAIPILSEQRRIVAIIEDQIATAEKARTASEAELSAIDALPVALLRRAFAGEL